MLIVQVEYILIIYCFGHSSYTFDFFPALPVPQMMELVLDGNVKEVQSKKQGNYTLGDGLVNGFPYWYQQDGKHAIWSALVSFGWIWLVGDKEGLGYSVGGMYVQYDTKIWPTQILDGFRYYLSSSLQSASLNDVFFKDCKYKRVVHPWTLVIYQGLIYLLIEV